MPVTMPKYVRRETHQFLNIQLRARLYVTDKLLHEILVVESQLHLVFDGEMCRVKYARQFQNQ